MTTILTGLVTGALFAIVAVGFTIVYTVTGTFNFAQAQFAMLGTIAAWIGLERLNWPVPLVIVAGFCGGALIGLAEERVAIRLLPRKTSHGELVTTVGASVIIAGVAQALFGQNARPVRSVLGSSAPISFLGGRVYEYGLVLIVLAVVVVGAAELLALRTLVGLASLATAEDREAATVRGINVGRLQIGAYMLAGGLLVALGPFIASTTYATTSIGDELNIKAFVAMALGGLGSPRGALVGGFAAGIVEAGTGRYLSSAYQNLALLILLLAVLMIRPHGLFGRAVERAV
jgi:branched-chain amino acid transport system permease protein